MEEEITYRVAQFTTLEQYAIINQRIVDYKNQLTGGEFDRTDTEYYYTPEPELVDGFYYMPAKPEFQEAGLFEDCVLIDEIQRDENTVQ